MMYLTENITSDYMYIYTCMYIIICAYIILKAALDVNILSNSVLGILYAFLCSFVENMCTRTRC